MTYSQEQARSEITALVEQFRAQEQTLLHEQEAQIENNYIRPLFRFLNWNVDNTGLSRAQNEFVLQRTEGGRRPDYVLRLEGNDLMVMDAKKVKYDMSDPRWLNQVYAYAYSTQNSVASRKMDFAILTDFQEFVVLDCTLLAARPEAVRNFRILDWRYDDYVKQFDVLWEVFERNHVLAASKTRDAGLWARYLDPKKVKANRVPPDKAFLAALDDDKQGWRVRLAKDMKKHNPALGGEVLTAATQLVIDRLLFIKVLSDREIEDDYLSQMAELVARDGLREDNFGWFKACRTIFTKLNQVYNGSIFEPRPELESVLVSNKVVRELLDDLLPQNSPYNFAVLPVEILGTIYEQFLGRVVHTTDKQVRIEDKPEVRKAGGVFYTPQYIVNYIVAQTVGKLLAECKTPADVSKLKILDPACGSGSFLLGAYDALIEWYEGFYGDKTRLAKKDTDAAYYDADGQVRLTAKLKRQILLDNLFGVDIDPQAVEVTRLSLSLKALEDTRRSELYDEVTLFHQRVLPDLTNNIQNGNSLIGSDYIFADVDELRRVRPFDWDTRFPEVLGAETKPSRSPQTSKVLTGFDAVIGNPPYIRIQAMKEWAPLEVEIYKEKYAAAGAGNYDIYVVFVEKALSLLNEQGRMGFILPHKFFNSKYGEPLRQIISQGKHLAHVVHFGDQQIFAGATTYTALLFLDKQGHEAFEFVRVTNLESWRNGELQERGEIETGGVTSSEWNFSVGGNTQLFERLEALPTRLSDVAARIFQGLVTGADPDFVLQLRQRKKDKCIVYSRALEQEFEIETEITRPLLKGAEIHRYTLDVPDNVILFPYTTENNSAKLLEENAIKKEFPLAWKYLLQVRKLLEAREGGKWRVPKWWQFGRNQNIAEMTKPKLLTQVLSKHGSFTPDANAVYCFVGGGNAGGYGVQINPSSPLSEIYVLGLLNSRLLDMYLKSISTPFRGGFFSYARRFIEKLPIRTIDFTNAQDVAQHDKMVALVERMLKLHEHRTNAKTQSDKDLFGRQIEATDAEIDELVFDLYGLSAEERALVRG